MNVLVACERSGVVREAFNAYSGVQAMSCDLAPPEDGRTDFHIQGDAFDALRAGQFDLLITHAPCTRIANCAALRLYIDGKKKNGRDPLKWQEMEQGARFFRRFFDEYDGPMCAENPIMNGHARRIVMPLSGVTTQIVQPHQFGADASKATVLWLRELPRLITYEESFVRPRYVCPVCKKTMTADEAQNWRDRKGVVICYRASCHMAPMKARWGNQTDSGQNRLPPSPTRAIDRARTYPGLAAAMAAAMAAQWIPFLLNRKSAKTN